MTRKQGNKKAGKAAKSRRAGERAARAQAKTSARGLGHRRCAKCFCVALNQAEWECHDCERDLAAYPNAPKCVQCRVPLRTEVELAEVMIHGFTTCGMCDRPMSAGQQAALESIPGWADYCAGEDVAAQPEADVAVGCGAVSEGDVEGAGGEGEGMYDGDRPVWMPWDGTGDCPDVTLRRSRTQCVHERCEALSDVGAVLCDFCGAYDDDSRAVCDFDCGHCKAVAAAKVGMKLRPVVDASRPGPVAGAVPVYGEPAAVAVEQAFAARDPVVQLCVDPEGLAFADPMDTCVDDP